MGNKPEKIMKNILAIIALIIAITYSLKLINAESDWKVFVGLASVGLAFYVFAVVLYQIFTKIKSRL